MRGRHAFLAALVVLGGCGSGQPSLSDQEVTALLAGVDRVRAAAAEGDEITAAAALSQLRNEVLKLTERGEIGADQAEEILAAAAEVADELGSLSEAPATTGEDSADTEPNPQDTADDTEEAEDDAEDEGDDAEDAEDEEDTEDEATNEGDDGEEEDAEDAEAEDEGDDGEEGDG